MNSLKLIITNRKYFSLVWLFAALNICIGTWVLYIPYVKNNLLLNDAQIGFAMFCLALGVLAILALVPHLSTFFGIGKVAFFGIILFSFSFIFPVIATSYQSLCLALFCVGLFSGISDVAINALVSEVETQENINIMSAAHGFFSLGGVLGASLGSIIMPYFKEPFYHLVMVFIVVSCVAYYFRKYYFLISEEKIKQNTKIITKELLKPLLVISIVAFVTMGGEGAIEHWSTLYFLEIIQVENNYLAGIGFIMFSVMMTVGRFFGDGISAKMGSLKIIFIGCILACFGYFCVLFSQFYSSLIGFSLLGLGLSVIIPEVYRIAGKTKGIKASEGIAIVSGIGFIGFLIGPVTLGYISNKFSLVESFGTLLLVTIIAMVLVYTRIKSIA